MSVEASKWLAALATLGFETFTVAGEGPHAMQPGEQGRADHILPGLAMDASEAPTAGEIADVLAPADLVVVENLCSLPLNPAAMAVVASVLGGRRALLHHHDLGCQRPHLAHLGPPPTDPVWAHVTVNDLSRRQLASWGIPATTVRNTFDTSAARASAARAQAVRQALGVGSHQRLVIQPTRAIERKNIPGGLGVAEALGATYWLSGPAEEGYGPTLSRLASAARCPVRWGRPGGGARDGPGGGPTPWAPTPWAPVEDMAAAYAAADVVVLPSTWEGFGNPAVEAAIHRRPLAIGIYPVAAELAALGFRWFPAGRPGVLASWLDQRPPGGAGREPSQLATHNLDIARRHLCLTDLPARLDRVMNAAGWSTW